MIKDTIREQIACAVHALVKHGQLKQIDDLAPINVTATKDRSHGDFASNVALLLAKSQGMAPLQVATLLQTELAKDKSLFARVEVAGPGFINLSLTEQAVASIVASIASCGEAYGTTTYATPKKALIEFVSANPTGGLHLGHARGAFVGDALARLLAAAGFLVTKEFLRQ